MENSYQCFFHESMKEKWALFIINYKDKFDIHCYILAPSEESAEAFASTYEYINIKYDMRVTFEAHYYSHSVESPFYLFFNIIMLGRVKFPVDFDVNFI